MSKEDREAMGKAGRQHVVDNYGMAKYTGLWYQVFNDVFENMGSWKNRKNYKSWEMFEL